MNAKMVGVAVSALLGSLPVYAADGLATNAIEERYLATGKQELKPDMGYVFIHSDALATFRLMKIPTEEEKAAYRAERQTALNAGGENNSDIDPLESRMMVQIGYVMPYSEEKGYVGYLEEIPPGTYIYYSTWTSGPQGYPGVCMCMGSVMFEVEAGRITNLGNFPVMRWASAEQAREAQVGWVPSGPPEPVDYILPARLAAFPNGQPEFRATGKINNFFGLVTARMPPIPGVLAYERDRVVDLKAEAMAASRPAD